jgi:hypothetical protein
MVILAQGTPGRSPARSSQKTATVMLGGLLLIGSEFASVPTGVGVGTSSYIAAQSVYWLGGMVLFGIGALIDTQDFSGVRPTASDSCGGVKVTR